MQKSSPSQEYCLRQLVRTVDDVGGPEQHERLRERVAGDDAVHLGLKPQFWTQQRQKYANQHRTSIIVVWTMRSSTVETALVEIREGKSVKMRFIIIIII